MREFEREVEIEEKMKVRLWGNEREDKSFCREKERREFEELENVKRRGRDEENEQKKKKKKVDNH